MVEFSPKPQKKKEKTLLFGLLGIAVLLFVGAALPNNPIPPAILQLLAVVSLVGAVMVITRSLMRNYTYAITTEEGRTVPDLVVTEIYGAKISVVCRISLDDISEAEEVTRENRRALAERTRGRCVFRYTAELFPESLIFVTVTENGEPYYLWLSGGTDLLRCLKSC